MSPDITRVIFEGWAIFVPFLLALCFHEYCHGWVANKLGDPTAKLMGRLTMNPLAHADPLGTFALPLLAIFLGTPFFGWAKPVPVNSRNLKNEKMGMFWVALAGPGSNIFLAVLGALLYGLLVRIWGVEFYEKTLDMARMFIMINLSLAFFNLLPIHPLDGGKIFAIFLPDKVNRKLEEMQGVLSLLLFILFLSGGLSRILFQPVVGAMGFLLSMGIHIFNGAT